jgi:guanylate kinase
MGTLFIVSAPSGTGKTSLVAAMVESLPNMLVSVSHTTRPIRPGEVDGVNYHFLAKNAFKQQIKQADFLEHAEVYGHYYGTSKDWVNKRLSAGKDVILEIEWQGAQQVREQVPDAVSIYILPPTKKALEKRLNARGQDNPEVIAARLKMAGEEAKHYTEYDYLVVNDQFEIALSDLRSIVRAHHCKQPKQARRLASLIRQLTKS